MGVWKSLRDDQRRVMFDMRGDLLSMEATKRVRVNWVFSIHSDPFGSVHASDIDEYPRLANHCSSAANQAAGGQIST